MEWEDVLGWIPQDGGVMSSHAPVPLKPGWEWGIGWNPERWSCRKVSHATVSLKPGMGKWKRMNPVGCSGKKASNAPVPCKPGMGTWNRMKPEWWSGKKASHATVPLSLEWECVIGWNLKDGVVEKYLMPLSLYVKPGMGMWNRMELEGWSGSLMLLSL